MVFDVAKLLIHFYRANVFRFFFQEWLEKWAWSAYKRRNHAAEWWHGPVFISFFDALRHESVGTEYLLDLLQSDGHLLMGVGSHEAEADKRVVRCNGRRNDGIDKDALVQQVTGDGKRLVVVTDEQGDDGRLGMSNLTTHVTESLKRLAGECPEVLLALRLGNKDVDGLHGSCCRCGP